MSGRTNERTNELTHKLLAVDERRGEAFPSETVKTEQQTWGPVLAREEAVHTHPYPTARRRGASSPSGTIRDAKGVVVPLPEHRNQEKGTKT